MLRMRMRVRMRMRMLMLSMLCCVPSAVACSQASRVIDLFKTWDVDGDGCITKGESRTALPEHAPRACAPMCIQLTRACAWHVCAGEFRKALPELGLWADPAEVDALFDSFDADGSGEITSPSAIEPQPQTLTLTSTLA